MQILRHGSGATVMLGRFVDATDGFTQETALTIANTDIKLLKHGATSLADKNSGGATHLANGIYRMSLDSTDTDTLGRLNVMCQPSGARPIEREYMVISANWYDSMVGNDVFQADVTQWLGTAVAAATAGVPNVNATQISGDSTAADNLESQYDGTGLRGVSYPLRQDQMEFAVGAGLPLNILAESFTLTTGTETFLSDYTDTKIADGGYHTIDSSGGTIDGYYQFDVDDAQPGLVGMLVNLSGSGTIFAQARNWTSSQWEIVARIPGDNSATERAYFGHLFAQHVGTGGDAGKVRIRFIGTSLGSATLSVDQIFVAAALMFDPATDAVANVTNVTNRVTANVDQLNGVSQSLLDLKDFADDGYDPSTNKVQGVVLVDTLTTYTDNTPQTGDSFARLGAPSGVSVSADVAAVKAETSAILLDTGTDGVVVNAHTSAAKAEIQQEADDALVAKGLDHLVSASVAGADVADNSIVAKLASKSATADWDSFDNTTDSHEAIADALASLPTAGPGPWGVVINVKSGGVNIQGADVTATNGSESYHDATDSSGNATFSLPTDDWDFYVYKPNYVQDDPPYEKSVTTHSLSGNNVTMTYDPPGSSLVEEESPMTVAYLTMHDLVSSLASSLGAAAGDAKNDNVRQAVRDCFDDFFAGCEWAEKKQIHRIQTQDSYATGTIAFDLTGGSSERLVTLTNGTFPSWAAYGAIVIGNEIYRVVSRLSNTTLQLDETFCPTADVAAGTSYVLYQEAYLLPADFEGNYDLHSPDHWKRCWIDPEDFVALSTTWRIGSAFRYTILPDERTPGRWSLRFWGYPSDAASLTFLYEKRRRTPILDGTETDSLAGTIAWTNGGTTITGTSTAFSDEMVGSVLRIGTSSQHPTHAAGRYPYKGEYIISAVASTTSLTLKTPVGLATASGVKYRITDLVSLDRKNHLALRKGTEAFYHLLAGSADSARRAAVATYEQQKMVARESQSVRRGRDSALASEGGIAPYTVEEQSIDD